MDMRYEYFSTFLTVIEKGSLLAAAKHLNTSVGTVSFQVGKLEEFFGVKLLERSFSGVKLTEDGRLASEKIRSILSEIEGLKSNFSRAPNKIVRVAFGNVPGVSVFPGALEEFRKENPDIEVTVKIKNSTECSSLLSSNDVDIAAACFILKEIDSERYSTIRLGTDKLVLVVSQEHELAGQGEVRLKDVLPLPIVMIGKDSGITKFLIQGLENCGYTPEDLNIIAEVNSVYTQLHSVVNGLGVAITSKLAAKGMNNCKIINITDFEVNRTIYIIYSRSAADPAVIELIDFLTKKGRELLRDN